MHRVRVQRNGGVAIIDAEGELDAYAAPDLVGALETVADDGRVLADLGAVSFMDSTALGVIARGVRQLRERGSTVRVVLPGSAARRIFEITTLDRALPVSPSRSEALAELE